MLYLFAFVAMHGDVFPWFIFPLLGWGIAVSLHAWNAYQMAATSSTSDKCSSRNRIKEFLA
jgi:hypothetical protein